MTTGVSTTLSANILQESNEMSNNSYDPVRKNVEESMFDRFSQRMDDHFMPTSSTVDKRV